MKKEELIELAKEARKNAYVPYSKFEVGAAILTKSGKIYKGANIENASYGLTNCAERTAIFKAISEGDHDLDEIAVIADTEDPVAPCGACRQVMVEFFNPKAKVYLANLKGDVLETTVEGLLPGAFTQEDLDESGK
ncbi:cytidine deaminase [Tepidibacillus infernus]|uniref:Cytidine deaminase n=1 Tax=Tepidibacillus decaturensis TaxID=1413211 RepID=A0A135L2F2_9BACI|nr:cytidine deaminase [Tepidibacillus decaturensis]KXG43188.1 cytidine deaminase [Tepidibacillus decaturensis]